MAQFCSGLSFDSQQEQANMHHQRLLFTPHQLADAKLFLKLETLPVVSFILPLPNKGSKSEQLFGELHRTSHDSLFSVFFENDYTYAAVLFG